jgi:hypothetical protein
MHQIDLTPVDHNPRQEAQPLQLPLDLQVEANPMATLPHHPWRDSRRVWEVYRLFRPFLEDFIANRKDSRIRETVSAAIAGNATDATVSAAQYDFLDSLLEDMEAYAAQELAIHGIPPFL